MPGRYVAMSQRLTRQPRAIAYYGQYAVPSRARALISGVKRFKLKQRVDFNTNTASPGGVWAPIYTNDPSSQQDWSSIAALFDLYKVYAIKIHFIPRPPNNVFGGVPSIVNAPVYFVYDANSILPLGAVNTAIQYDNMKSFGIQNVFKYFKYMLKNTATGGSVNGYLPTSAPVADMAILGYGDNFIANQPLGDVIITHYLKCKNRN